MKVSLVLVSKNEEEYVKKFFASLKKQTLKPDEVILVDSSSDNTAKIAKPFVDKLIVTPTKCAGHARNIGVKNSKGDIIVFTDVDTILHPDWLEELVKPFENPKVSVVQGQVFLRSYSGKNDKWMFSTGLKEEGRMYLNNCNSAFRRKVLKEFPLANDINWDDIELGYRLSKKYIIYGCKGAKVYHYGSKMEIRFKTNKDIWDYSFKYSLGYLQILKKYKNMYWFLRIWYNIFGSFIFAPNKKIGFKIFLFYVTSFFYILLFPNYALKVKK